MQYKQRKWNHIQLILLNLLIGHFNSEGKQELDEIVDDLDTAEGGEASEEAHRASNEAQLGLICQLHEFVYALIQKSEKILVFTLTSRSISL